MPKEMKRPVGRPAVAKSIKEFLSAPGTKKLWDEGKAQVTEGGGGFAEYDDGKYRCQVVSATTGRSQASGRWQHVMGFKFLEGEYKGQTCFQYQGLENPMGFTILISQLSKMGVEMDGPEDIESADKELMKSKPVVDIRLRTKGEFQNLIVIKAADAEDAEESEEENDDSDEDEKEEVETAEESEEEEADDDSDEEEEDEEETKPEPKKTAKKKVVEEDEDEESEEDEDDEDEDEDEKEEEPEPEEKVTLDVGTKVKIKYEDENVVGKIVKVDEEKSRIKVKLKNGDKVWVGVPDDVIDVIG